MAIGRVNTGGGLSNAFAVIAVTYPVGSVCTCTNGTKTLKAKDTSGSYLFLIPEAGTWTVSCTDGTDTDSESISITTQYQAESVTLSYWNGEIYDNGNKFESITGGWEHDTYTNSGSAGTTATDHGTYLSLTWGSNFPAWGTANKFDVTPFSTMHVLMDAPQGGCTMYIGLCDAKANYINNQVAYGILSPAAGSNYEYTLDVSGFDGPYYVFIRNSYSTYIPGYQFNIKKVWFT